MRQYDMALCEGTENCKLWCFWTIRMTYFASLLGVQQSDDSSELDITGKHRISKGLYSIFVEWFTSLGVRRFFSGRASKIVICLVVTRHSCFFGRTFVSWNTACRYCQLIQIHRIYNDIRWLNGSVYKEEPSFQDDQSWSNIVIWPDQLPW